MKHNLLANDTSVKLATPTFTILYKIGVMLTKRFVMVRENMQEMNMVMVSVKFMSIPWKAFGHFCGLG
jgi:hypothetical protein